MEKESRQKSCVFNTDKVRQDIDSDVGYQLLIEIEKATHKKQLEQMSQAIDELKQRLEVLEVGRSYTDQTIGY